MNKLYLFSRLVCLTLLLCSIYSCKDDFLENESKATVSDATQWATESSADINLNDLYSNLWRLNNTPDQLDNFTDDNDAGPYWPSHSWKQGVVTPSHGNIMGYSNFDGNSSTYANWNDGYSRIRKCNLFIQKVNEHQSHFSADWMKKRLDEARFLRAFTYTFLLKHFGGVPIIREPQNRIIEGNEIERPRSTFEETVTFIASELEAIINNGSLAVKYNKGDSEAGRVTLGAALALKGWIEVYAASPAFNAAIPAAAEGTGASVEQLKLVGYGNYEAERWAKAAATNKQFIDMYGGQYSLFSDLATFWKEDNEYNSEVIFDRQYVPVQIGSNFEVFGGPVYLLGNYATWGNYCPTQELVDQFAMANGKSITDPTSGYDPQNPYKNREKRFYDFIIYDGAPFKTNWMPRTDTIYTRIDKVRPSKNEIDFAQTDVSNTAYYFKKRLNTERVWGWGQSGLNYVFMRYAEVLLNYAEAQNEAVGPDASVYQAINQIRTRSSLPTLEATYGGQSLSQAEMREVIRRERRTELCFENKRFYDIIRWRIAHTVMNKDLHGMKISNTVPGNNSGKWVYQVVGLNHDHIFHQKMYVNPIPQNVIDQNQKLIQNPGY